MSGDWKNKDFVKSRIGYLYYYRSPDAIITSETEFGKRCPGVASHVVSDRVRNAVREINGPIYNHLLDLKG